MELREHGRYGYSPIVERPDYDWPEGKRLAVYIAHEPLCWNVFTRAA